MFGALKLKLYHEPLAAPENAPETPRRWQEVLEGPVFRWETCLRSVVLVPEDSLTSSLGIERSSGEWLQSDEAYRRLLQIICGLHSPLVGETEVFGQFKDAIDACLKEAASETCPSAKGPGASIDAAYREAFQSTIRQWSKALIEDVKIIRQKNLIDLGSQSYGSLIRKEVRAFQNPRIDFLGAGRLTAEILPWLLKSFKAPSRTSDSAPIRVHARDVLKAQSQLSSSSPTTAVSFVSLGGPAVVDRDDETAQRILIVAAPMNSQEIHRWAENRAARFDLVLDLRSESSADRLQFSGFGGLARVRSLGEIFSSIEKARGQAEMRKTAALRQIDECVGARLSAATHRPFGWDDVWS